MASNGYLYLRQKLILMTDFDKTSPEYISNGHYRINGTDFMSVWTFKKKNMGMTTPNKTDINGPEGKKLAQICDEVYSTKPDFGNFNEILVFPIEELKKYYS